MSVKQTVYDWRLVAGALALMLVAGTSTAWAQTPKDAPSTPLTPAVAAAAATTKTPEASGPDEPQTERVVVAVQSGPPKPTFEIYGFAMMDIGHNFKQINPNWFDTMRVTKLPSSEKQFGEDHTMFAGVRQSRLGVRSTTPTAMGDLKTTFEFELFGTGVDEGQTTFRLRHAYGELGNFGAGQYWSPFMDPDVFPNSLEYWGPTGMVFFRNVQVRWYAHRDDHQEVEKGKG